MSEIIVAEKPSASQKIAFALADDKPKKDSINKVPVYKLKHKGKDIIVASAVGHLFTIGETSKTSWKTYPIYDVQWVPTYEQDKNADYSKNYIKALQKLKKEGNELTIACDYDIEGEVIGLNVMRHIFKLKDANRMKFSTLTKPDLVKAYEGKSKNIDWGQAKAGEARHILDFFYGVNITRALSDALNSQSKGFKVLSTGRVQGPALKIIVDKEKDIRAFKPEPYWELELITEKEKAEIKALHEKDKIWDKKKAEEIFNKIKSEKSAKVITLEKKRFKQTPPVPFDLTSLQIEAHRVFRIKPKQTLDIAQSLYTEGYISYPRTSSQKLPKNLGLKKILELLKDQKDYTELASKVLKTKLIPNEGKKTDDAHPAIYPTGLTPKKLTSQEAKVYDLIVKRFFAVFGEPAIRETLTIKFNVKNEIFIAKGTTTIDKGWHTLYAPYVKLEENELPLLKENEELPIKEINKHDKQTKPPKRYTQSSIIKELEKRGLGTKATRAQIIETLFQRNYVAGDDNIEATELGIKISETLERYVPEIVDVDLTKSFEEDMEKIRKHNEDEQKVLEKAKKLLNKIIEKFKQANEDLGKALADASDEAIRKATTIGKCPNCDKGNLVIKKGKFGRFIACDNYPECKTIFNLPQKGTIKPTEKLCQECGMPLIIIKFARSSPKEVCINPECPTNKKPESQGYPEEGMQCPVCKEGKMILRKGYYGEFLACDRYPKCKTIMRIVDGKVNTNPIVQTSKTKKKSKKK